MKVIEAQHDEESGIDVAPLIDILFTLIIILLLTTTFEEEEKAPEIQLPRLGGASLASKSRPMTINVTQTGEYKVQDIVYSIEALRDKLFAVHVDSPEKKIVIRGDALALHGKTTAALAAASEAGFDTANIAWDTSTPKE